MGRLNITLCIVLAAAGGPGCATVTPPRAEAPEPREKDSTKERIAAMQENDPIKAADAAEKRFGSEENRERREGERAAKAERKSRVDVVGKDGKPPPKK